MVFPGGRDFKTAEPKTRAAMKIATFNVNGVNGRLPVLLRWLEETSPDVVCLQELKSETFPQGAVRMVSDFRSWCPLAFARQVRPRARLEGYVETLKARLAAAEAVGGAGDCQGGEGSRSVLGARQAARGRATSALMAVMAVAHGLRLALPGAFPSTTPLRLFDRLSYRLKTSRSRTRRSRASASPSSRPQRSGRRATATRERQSQKAVANGGAWTCGAAGG
jgi:hypothetical protein